MGLLGRFFRKQEEERKELSPEDIAEVPEMQETGSQTTIVVDKLDSFIACDRILRKIKSNNIVIASMKDLRDANMDELKQAVNRLKTSVASLDGDIAGVGEEWLIIAPKSAKVQRQAVQA